MDFCRPRGQPGSLCGVRGPILVAADGKAQAEDIALKDYAWIPMRFSNTLDVVQPYVKGWISNARNINRTRWLWIEKQTAAR